MATKTWYVTTMERDIVDGYVHTVIYGVAGEDGKHKATITGSINLPKPPILVPYTTLNEKQVVEWVKENLAHDRVAAIENAIELDIAAKKSPTTDIVSPEQVESGKSFGKPW